MKHTQREKQQAKRTLHHQLQMSQVRRGDQPRYPHLLWPLRWTIAHSKRMVPLLTKKRLVAGSSATPHTHTHTPTQCHRHTDTQTHRRTNTHRHTDTQRHAHTPTHRPTDAQTHRHTDTQTHRHTDTQTHRHTDTQTHRHTDTQTHRHTHTALRQGSPLKVAKYGSSTRCRNTHFSKRPSRKTRL